MEGSLSNETEESMVSVFARTEADSPGARIGANLYNLTIGLVLGWGFFVYRGKTSELEGWFGNRLTQKIFRAIRAQIRGDFSFTPKFGCAPGQPIVITEPAAIRALARSRV